MDLDSFKFLLNDCCNDISFFYNGNPCGIISEVADYKPVYHVWYGTDAEDFYDVQSVLTAPFFAGKSLEDLCEQLDFEVS